jgi:hypothetical protein
MAQNSILYPYHMAFSTGLLEKNTQMYMDSLPPEPNTWQQALRSDYCSQWKQAAQKEIQNLTRKQTYQYVPKAQANGKQILPLRWVFKYKFDTNGTSLNLRQGYAYEGTYKPHKKRRTPLRLPHSPSEPS